ncbi:MAG: hypothetical protein SD837_18665 [Candidatus Electrothrix scaldis]|nr:MAG: hypothetical protein SD837_18665 [Candidatus Electrothrix sp. GW3-3]
MQKIVRIGPSAGQIGEMTKDYIHFIDEAGERRRVRMVPPFPDWSSNIVGIRILEPPAWRVNLSGYESGVQGVTFIFEGYQAAYNLLLNPLSELGLRTMDAT